MSRKRTLVKEKKTRATKTLREVIGTDLLTWKDKLIQGQVSGLYSLTNEQAYFKCPGEPASMSFAAFEREIKKIDPAFTIVAAEGKTPDHCLQGHSIYFNVPVYEGYIKVCNVGKNRDYTIPADSVGRVAKYKGESFEYSGNFDEEALLYRGWVAALECCKTAYAKWEFEGISPAMVLNPKEVLNLRQAFSIIGAREEFQKGIEAHKQMIEADNALIMATEEPEITEDSEIIAEEENLVEEKSEVVADGII